MVPQWIKEKKRRTHFERRRNQFFINGFTKAPFRCQMAAMRGDYL